MTERCKESKHRWKNNGEESIKVDLMVQPQICTRCDAQRDHVPSLSRDKDQKGPWFAIAIGLIALGAILYFTLHK